MVTAPTGVPNMGPNVISSSSGHTMRDAPVKSDRRSNKPIMEKRRRARINNCLNDLKTLLLDATKKDPARHSKLEKADILEKTVKHLQDLQRQQTAMQQALDPKVMNKYKAGFAECANEVSRFPGIEPAVKRRLLQHLSSCVNSVKSEMHQQQRQASALQAQQLHAQMLPSPPSSPEQDQQHMAQHTAQQQHAAAVGVAQYLVSSPLHLQHTANGYFLPNGLQVIPTKLPNGSVALMLPQSAQQQQQQRQQASPAHLGSLALPYHQQLMQVPSRTASTSSASSHSSINYEHASCSPNATQSALLHYAPPSPANSYEAMDCKPQVSYYQQPQPQPHQAHQQPLSLVIKKNIQEEEEEQPWRPW